MQRRKVDPIWYVVFVLGLGLICLAILSRTKH